MKITKPEYCKCGSQMWTCSRCRLHYCPTAGCEDDHCGCAVKRQFTTQETRDRWIDKNYPDRKCSDVPGFFYCKGDSCLYVFGLTVTEYPQRWFDEAPVVSAEVEAS